MIIFIVSIACALGMSFLCSLLEAALLSVTPSQLATIRQRNQKTGEICKRLKNDIERSIAVILILNTAAHTIGATVAGAQFNVLWGEALIWLFSLLFTVTMVQFTEILPKTLGVHYNRQILAVAARPLNVMVLLMYPFIQLVHLINRPFERVPADGPTATEEISALAGMARSTQLISSRQERIINAAPRLSEQTAEQIMIPVENISFLSTTQTMSEAINAAHTDFHTRYPVCEDGDRDKVVGYVNFKELVASFRANPERTNILEILRPINTAAPEDSAANLLERFATQHCHMSIVCDAGGHTLGLITLEDIVEELVGDLDDEFDPLPRTFYSPSESFWVVGGGNSLSMVARETRLNLPKRAEPLSIWFSRMLDRPPRVGDLYRYHNVEFYVRKIRRGRVLEFNVRKIKNVDHSA